MKRGRPAAPDRPRAADARARTTKIRRSCARSIRSAPLLIHPRWRRDPRLRVVRRRSGSSCRADLRVPRHRRLPGHRSRSTASSDSTRSPRRPSLPSEIYLGDVRAALPAAARRGAGATGRRRRTRRHAPRRRCSSSAISRGGTCRRSMTGASSSISRRPVTSVILDVEPGHVAALRRRRGVDHAERRRAAAARTARASRLRRRRSISCCSTGAASSNRSAFRPRRAARRRSSSSRRALTGRCVSSTRRLPDPPLFAQHRAICSSRSRRDRRSDRPRRRRTRTTSGSRFAGVPRRAPGVIGVASGPAAPPPLDADALPDRAPTGRADDDRLDAGRDDDENYTAGDRAYGTGDAAHPSGVDLMTVVSRRSARPAAGAVGSVLARRLRLRRRRKRRARSAAPAAAARHGSPVPRARRRSDRTPERRLDRDGDARLEKHVPPPLPAAPDLTSGRQARPSRRSPACARACSCAMRRISRPQERTILGTHYNAIILTWGWHDEQRRQDPFAHEFRVYTDRGAPRAACGPRSSASRRTAMIASTSTIARRPRIRRERRRAESIIDAGAQFRVLAHGAGPSTTSRAARARARCRAARYVPPQLGPVRAADPPDAGSDTRRASGELASRSQPIDARTVYSETLLRSARSLARRSPRDCDARRRQLRRRASRTCPIRSRPTTHGRATRARSSRVRCEGRWHGRPVIVDAPSLAPVPVIVTPEPGARPLTFRLDLSPHATLAAGDAACGRSACRTTKCSAPIASTATA